MDLRGSRRAFEAVKIFLTMDSEKESSSLLPIQIPKLVTAPKLSSCLTYPCTWALSKLCLLLSLCVSHPASTPVLVFILHFLVWCYELLTDVVFINNLWNFRIPLMYPRNMSYHEHLPLISYESMTVDLYAPLLVLMLTFSSLFLLLSCSWSHLCDQYRHSRQLASADRENDRADQQDPTSLINR